MKKRLMALIVSGGCLLCFTGCREDMISPGKAENPKKADVKFSSVVKAEKTEVTDCYEAVGTVRPKTESRIESLVTAHVKSVEVSAGEKVKKDRILVTLDSRQSASRLAQARQANETALSGEKEAAQAIASAQAVFNQADAEYKRIQKYFSSQAATTRELEDAKARFLQAEAGVRQAREALSGSKARIRQSEDFVKEAEIALGYTEIKAQADGEILTRTVEPGDLASPGKTLFTMKTSGFMRLEAFVREGLIGRVKPSMTLMVSMPALASELDATIEEIVPYADPRTRSFLVKASIPPADGVYPGMFGKLKIPVEKHEAVILPVEAVQHVGQLELVNVRKEKDWELRYVKTGAEVNGKIEILSGLDGGEMIGYNPGKH